jgi:hypothetical protein
MIHFQNVYRLLLNRGAGKMLLLPELHPSDRIDIANAVHTLQMRLLMRPTYKKYWPKGPQKSNKGFSIL